MTIAPFIANAPDGLFGYLQEVNGCYSIPILTIIVVGYLTKRVPAIAAKIAIISGVVLYSISQFVLAPYFGDDYPHFLHVMAILFVFNVLLMLGIGKLYPRESLDGLSSFRFTFRGILGIMRSIIERETED